jgi:O-antigen/teichoic acid export membrane protein
MFAPPVENPSLHRAACPIMVTVGAANAMPAPAALPSPGNRPLLAALLDQAAVSCGNFLTNVLLARSLPVEQYGVFALFLDAILFLNSLQAALLIYPLTVRCPLMEENELRRYSGACVLMTLILALPLGLALAAYGVFIGAASVAVWAVIGQTLWQCQETLRRTLLARKNYSRALVGDVISYLGQAVILALLVLGSKADVPRAFMSMAITSLAAALVQGAQIGVKPVGLKSMVRLGRSFWLVGRWVMTANLTAVITSVCCSYTLARSHGNAAMGQYAALSNLLRIANPLFITLATLIVPAVAMVSASASHSEGNQSRMLWEAWHVSRHFGLHGAALLLPFWAILLLFPEHAIALLYPRRPEYLGLTWDLRMFVCVSALTLINIVVASTFNGLRRNRRAMAAQVVGAGACLVVTIPLTIWLGLEGLLIGMMVSNATVAATLIALYQLLKLQGRKSGDSQRSSGLPALGQRHLQAD